MIDIFQKIETDGINIKMGEEKKVISKKLQTDIISSKSSELVVEDLRFIPIDSRFILYTNIFSKSLEFLCKVENATLINNDYLKVQFTINSFSFQSEYDCFKLTNFDETVKKVGVENSYNNIGYNNYINYIDNGLFFDFDVNNQRFRNFSKDFEELRKIKKIKEKVLVKKITGTKLFEKIEIEISEIILISNFYVTNNDIFDYKLNFGQDTFRKIILSESATNGIIPTSQEKYFYLNDDGTIEKFTLSFPRNLEGEVKRKAVPADEFNNQNLIDEMVREEFEKTLENTTLSFKIDKDSNLVSSIKKFLNNINSDNIFDILGQKIKIFWGTQFFANSKITSISFSSDDIFEIVIGTSRNKITEQVRLLKERS